MLPGSNVEVPLWATCTRLGMNSCALYATSCLLLRVVDSHDSFQIAVLALI